MKITNGLKAGEQYKLDYSTHEVLSDGTPTVWLRCCRWWRCIVGAPLGRCGYCREQPRFISKEEVGRA